MVVADGGYGAWGLRLERASTDILPDARWLMAEVGGPLDVVGRMAASDTWGGPFADYLHVAVRMLERDVAAWGEHLGRLHGALQTAGSEAENAARLEAAGIVPSFDLPGALAPWRRWPTTSPGLPADWAGGGQRGSVVWVFPERARHLAEAFRQSAEPLRGVQRRVAVALAEVGFDTPPFLQPAVSALDEIAGEVDWRVTLLEAVDQELAGAFGALAAEIGLPGSLAPPGTFDPADPLDSARIGVAPPASAGPGRQATQAMEADPVSTSTGNFLYHMVDLVQPARGVPLVFTRTYNSLLASVAGPLGFGWSEPFSARLVVDGDNVRVLWGDGREVRYSRVDGGLAAPPGNYDRLALVGGEWELITKAKVTHHFGPEGRMVGLSDRSENRSTVLRNEGGRLAGFVDAAGITIGFDADGAGRIAALSGPLGRRWAYAYDQAGDLITVTDPEGGVSRYGYDPSHRLTFITDGEDRLVVANDYDHSGRVVRQRDGTGATWRYAYTAGCTLITDPAGHRKRFEFDARYRTTTAVDALGATTRFRWNDADQLTAVTDPTGRVFAFGWDARGNLTSAKGPGTDPVVFEWDASDNLTAVRTADGTGSAYAWDDHSRPVSTRSPAGVTLTATWRADGQPDTITDATGAVTRYGYDPAGRLSTAADPFDATTAVAYDAAGRPTTETHASGAQTHFEWDRADRLVAVTDATEVTTGYAYDRSGRLVGTTDGLGRTTAQAYDERGLLGSITDPASRTTSFAYDLCGRLVLRTDARNLPVSSAYDAAGRLTRIGSPGLVPITYTWDAAGRLVGMSDETGPTSWELDEAGRPLIEHRPDGIDITHRYDSIGRRVHFELHRHGELVGAWDHDIDPDGRIGAVTDTAGAVANLAYDSAGRLERITWPNQVRATWTHDPAGQPVSLALADPTSVIARWDSTYDEDGNRTCVHTRTGRTAPVVDYHYDSLGRLTGLESCDATLSWTWDALSNRTGSNGTDTALYDSADQISADEVSTYQHDDAGNMLNRQHYDGDGQLALAYDPLGRVTTITHITGDVHFAYDGLGRRTRGTTTDGTTLRVFDGTDVLAELSPDGQAELQTTAGLVVLARHSRDGVRYLHPGPNTEVAAVTDDEAAVLARYDYHPFGGQSTAHGDPAAAGPYGYCGTLGVRHEIDGLLDMRARLYDPILGRFLTPDPWPAQISDPTTINRYLYALGDPVSQVDPYGLFCITGKNKAGKGRGLKDVTQRAGQAIATPLDITSTVATGVAAVAVGITAVCPFPCGVIIAPVTAGASELALTTGFAAGLAHCAASWSLTDFDCAVGVAEGAVGGFMRGALAVGQVLEWSEEALRTVDFGSAIFATFLRGTVIASDRRNK